MRRLPSACEGRLRLAGLELRGKTSPASKAAQRLLFHHYRERAAAGSLPPLAECGLRVFSQFEEDGKLVVVDYKSDAIADEQALEQAAHHAPQLQLYGRGLTQAIGLPVRERLVVFTALARSVPV